MKQITLRNYLRGKTYTVGTNKLITPTGDVYIIFGMGLTTMKQFESNIIKYLDTPFNQVMNGLLMIDNTEYHGIFKT